MKVRVATGPENRRTAPAMAFTLLLAGALAWPTTISANAQDSSAQETLAASMQASERLDAELLRAFGLVASGRQAQEAGRFDEAERAFAAALQIGVEQLQEIVKALPAPGSPADPTVLENLKLSRQAVNQILSLAGAAYGNFLGEQGRYSEAEALNRTRLSMQEDAAGTARALASVASSLYQQGRYSEAEDLFRRSLVIRETQTPVEERGVAITLANLASALVAQQRFAEAETLYRSALTRFRSLTDDRAAADVQRESQMDVAVAHSNLGVALAELKRYADAEQQFRNSLELDPNSPGQAITRANLSHVLKNQGRHSEADGPSLDAVKLLRTRFGEDHPEVAKAISMRGEVLEGAGRYAEAADHYRRALAIGVARRPAGHPTSVRDAADLGRLLLDRLGSPEAALPLFRTAGDAVAARSGSRAGMHRWAKDELDRFRPVFANWVRAAWELAQAAGAPSPPSVDPTLLRGEAFEAAQWGIASEAGDALAKTAARFAGGSTALSGLVSRREALIARRGALEQLLAQGVPGGGEPRRAAEHRVYQQVRAELTEIEGRMEREFPAYAELTSPKPLSIAETQQLLRPDEGLLLVLSAPDAAYVWGISRDKVAWARVEAFGEKALGEAVHGLRETLTPKAPANAPVDKFDEAAGGFDVTLAHEVYDQLVRPVEAAFAGKKTLITVTTGALSSLPLAVLVTGPPSGDGADDRALRNTPWLLDRYALASLPSVSSLKALRCHLVASPAERSPGCATAPKEDRRAPSAKGLTLVAFGAPALGGRPARTGRGGPPSASSVFEGRLAVPERLRAMPSLPGSAEELTGVARRFPARARLVRRGGEATETTVKVRDRESLAGARYVLFSTHGLLAAESGPAAEPGLVLTPPAKPSELDDGFLTASETAQLRLAADFVVLSACNTAAPDGSSGGEGLSGLARAFFYAGARSVLVSHWQVDDKATTALMLKTFAGVEGPGRIGRAAAVQAAARAVRADPRWSHPAYWAAFTLVGDPDEPPS